MSNKGRSVALSVGTATLSAMITLALGADSAMAATRYQLLSALPVATVTVPAAPARPHAPAGFEHAGVTDDGKLQVLVELTDAPTSVAWAAAFGNAPRTDAVAIARAGSASRAQALRIANAQTLVAAELTRRGARELYRVSKSLNAIAVAVDAADIEKLAATAGVRRVLPLVPEYPTNSTSVSFLGTPSVWANTIGLPAGADGTGVRVGIIDTGLDYMHASFGGTGLLADYQAEQTATANFTTAGSFPTAKVVGGIDLAGDAYTGSNAAAQDPNPMDCNGHGSHVAGSAGGFGVKTDGTTFTGPFDADPATYSALRIGPGTAPQAQLYGIRVFGCTGSTNLTIQAVDWALDPNGDNDLADKLDVINLSLGSNFGTALSSSSAAVENAAAAGVVVVASAGNANDTFFISGSPGASQRTIATAASVDGGINTAGITINAPSSIAGGYFAGTASFGPPANGETANVVQAIDPIVAVTSPTATDGCDPLTNAAAIAGNIALIDRGTCDFNVKAMNAQNAGAIGVIIANNAPTSGGNPPGAGGTNPAVTIPTLVMAQDDSNAVKAILAGSGTVNATLRFGSGGDTMAIFSSRGPRSTIGSPLRLKPDIAAPGFQITSVQTGHTCFTQSGCTGLADASGFVAGSQPLVLNGTSMAAPHMAGIMALLRQLKPTWSVEELKALAMNYATHDLNKILGPGSQRFGLSRIGAGRVDPAQAATADVVAMNAEDVGAVSVTFDPEVAGMTTRLKRVRVVNKGATPQTFDLAFDTLTDAPGVAFSLPGGNSVTVPAGSTVEFDVQMAADPSQMDQRRDPALSAQQFIQTNFGDQPRNFLTEEQAYLTFSQSAALKLRVPVYMAAKPASQMTAPDTIVTGGAPTGSTTIPLSGSDLCSGTLGAGPTCTGSFPTDRVSLVTPLELQVVSPQDPALAGGFEHTDIRYAGVGFIPGAGSPSLTNDLLMFGVAGWGDWATLNDVSYNVCIDNNEDGVYDRSIINASPSIFVAGASLNDTFVRVVQNLSTGSYSILGTASPVNLVGPNSIDSGLHLNNVMVLSASLSTLGFTTTADTNFRYKVTTCPASNPGCARSTTGDRCSGTAYFDRQEGPYTYNWGAQGVNFGGSFLADDLNGDALPVTWNTANMTANGSLGALLLHHHNAKGTRAEVVTLDTAQRSDVAIAASVSNPAPALGTNVTLTLTATNNGPNDTTGVEAIHQLAPGLTYVSHSGSGSFDDSTGVWTVGALTNGDTATLQIVATVESTDALTNYVNVSSATIDTNPANDRAEVTVSAPRSSDLSLQASVSAPSVTVGGSLTYTFTVTNTGVDPAYSINLNEAFAAFPSLDPASFVASQGVYTPATGVWNLASLGNGQTATLALTFTAPDYAGSLELSGTVGSTTSDPDTTDNTASAAAIVLSPSVVTGTKTRTGDTYPGGTVTYTVTLSNSAATAQQDNPGNEFTDVLPTGLTLVSASATSGTAVATVGTNTVTWNGAIPGNGSTTITITATIGGANGDTASNQGAIAYDADGNGTNEAAATTDDPSVGGANDPTVFTIRALTDLSLTLTDSPDPVTAGGQVTYVATAQNAGPNAATSVIVQFTKPAGTTYVSGAVAGGGVCSDGTPVICTYTGPLNTGAGAARAATIVLGVPGSTANGTVLTATADVAGAYDDSNSANDDAMTSTTVSVNADLAIAVVDTPDPVNAGTSLSYAVTATNNGPSDANDVAIAFTLAPGTTLTSATPGSGGTCVATTCTFAGATASGGTRTVTYVVGVSPAAVGGSMLQATAAVSSTSNDGNTANNSAIVNTTVDAIADVSVTLTNAPASVMPGDDITYTATATNAGPGVAQSIAVALALPAGTTLTSATPSAGGSCTATTCTFAGMTTPGGTHTVTYVARVGNGAASGNATGTATVSATTTDPNTANNSASATTSVLNSADVSVTLTNAPASVLPGGNVTYTATATNGGPGVAQDVAIALTLPAGTTLTSATPSAGGSCTTTTCTFAGATASGATHTVTYVANVATGTGAGDLTGTATVSAATNDPNSANNTASATTSVGTSADLSLVLTASSNTIAPNGTLTLTAVSTNLGPSPAQDVSISIPLNGTLLYSSHTAVGATCTTPIVGGFGTVTCTWPGTTAANQARTLVLVVSGGTPGAVMVMATTDSPTADQVSANDQSGQLIGVQGVVVPVPVNDRLAMLLAMLLLAAFGAYALRRRQI